jgi:hypothetical protein
VHQTLEKTFKGKDDVVFVYLQIPWNGFARNSFEAGLKDVASFKLDSLYAYCPREDGAEHPSFASEYYVDGTPWTLVIDRKGTVCYTDRTSKAGPVDVAIKKALKATK